MASYLKITVKCPNCRESLMNQDHPVDELPSIHIKVKVVDRIGDLYLSTIYGSYNKRFENVADVAGGIVECSCPHCFVPFPFHQNCECGAPIAGLSLCIGGTIKFCTRNGCRHHSLEFEEIDSAFMLFQNQSVFA